MLRNSDEALVQTLANDDRMTTILLFFFFFFRGRKNDEKLELYKMKEILNDWTSLVLFFFFR